MTDGSDPVSLESATRHLMYDPEFKSVIHEHPGIISAAKNLMQMASLDYNPSSFTAGGYEMTWDKEHEIWEETAYQGVPRGRRDPNIPLAPVLGRGTFLRRGDEFTDDKTGLSVIMLGKSRREYIGQSERTRMLGVLGQFENPVRRDVTDYFKLSIDGKEFLLKRSEATQNPGFQEFENAKRARELLADMNKVRVILPLLGYVDSHESWLVSPWTELESVGFASSENYLMGGIDDYGNNLPQNEDRSDMVVKFRKVKNEIINRLEDGGMEIEDKDVNFFMNPATEESVLFDITTKGGLKLNQP